MAQWRKVIVSGSNAVLNQISASGDIVPTSDNGVDLGSSALEFKDLYIDGTAYLDSATISAGTITGITDLVVADGGTGASTFTDGGVLLGSGTGAITATAVLANGQLLIGDNSTDPTVATLTATANETSIANGAGSITIGLADDVTIPASLTVTTDLTVSGGDITLTGAATDVDLIDNTSSALSFDASGKAGILEIDTTDTFERVTMSGGLSVSGAVSGSVFSGSGAATFGSIVLDTVLAVAEGGTGVSSLTDKAVLISQDSSTDAVGALALTGNGEIVVGGTNGPAVEAAADVAGTGLDAAVGDGTLAINVAAAQTSITSIINSGLGKIGTDAAQEYITFGTSDEVNVFIDNTERLSVTATGVDVTGAVTISGNLDVNGTLTTIDTSNSYVADKFMIIASGSTSDTDGGIIVQNAATAGYALGYDSGIDRWVFDADLAHNATNIGPDAYVGVIETGTGDGDSQAVPIYGGTTNGVGTIYVDTDDSEIWIYA
jgi:hypothetical protein